MPAKKKAAGAKSKLSGEIKSKLKSKLLRGFYKPKEQKKADAKPAATVAQPDKIKKKKVAPFKRRRLAPKEGSYEITFNLARSQKTMYVKIVTFFTPCSSRKEKAPRAIRDIKRYVRAFLGTSQVRVDSELNKYLWFNGISNPPRQVRLALERKPLETSEKSKTGLKKYVVNISHIIPETFKGLLTKRNQDAAEPAAAETKQ